MWPINIFIVFYCRKAQNTVKYLHGTSLKLYKDYKENDDSLFL